MWDINISFNFLIYEMQKAVLMRITCSI